MDCELESFTDEQTNNIVARRFAKVLRKNIQEVEERDDIAQPQEDDQAPPAKMTFMELLKRKENVAQGSEVFNLEESPLEKEIAHYVKLPDE